LMAAPASPNRSAQANGARSGQEGPGSGRLRSGRSAGGTTLRTTPGAGEGPPCRSAGHSPAAFVGRPRRPLGPAQSPVVVGAHPVGRIVRPAGLERPLVHLPEPACPCCRQALGEFSEVTPHEGSRQV